MKARGKIVEFHNIKNSFGRIITTNGLDISFNREDCNYDYIRVEDFVRLDLHLDENEKYIPKNITFIKNREISELDRYYIKQLPVECKVFKQIKNYYILHYKSISIFLWVGEDSDLHLDRDEVITVYIKELSNGGLISASLTPTPKAKLHLKYLQYIGTDTSFSFEIVEITNHGLNCKNDGDRGFVPNSLILPLKKENLKIGDTLEVLIKSTSPKKGLILSVTNKLCDNALAELRTAYQEYLTLKGKIIDVGIVFYKVDYKGIQLKLNKSHCLQYDMTEGTEISFKVVNFDSVQGISISEIETSNYNIIPLVKKKYIFRGVITEIKHNGVFIKLNEYYKGFIYFHKISEDLSKDELLTKLKVGYTLNVTVFKFDFVGILLSRVSIKSQFRNKFEKSKYEVNNKVIVSSKVKIFAAGLLVKNRHFKGIIKSNNIIPDSVIEQINFDDFIKYCYNIFIPPCTYQCIIVSFDKIRDAVEFDFDYSFPENMEIIKKILLYFIENDELLNIVKEFYIEKISVQQSNDGNNIPVSNEVKKKILEISNLDANIVRKNLWGTLKNILGIIKKGIQNFI